MIDFVFDNELAAEAETEGQGGTFGVLETGIYKVTINFASLDKTSKGNNTLSLDITTDTGHKTTLWSSFGCIDKTWSSGSENFGYKDFMSFMGACNVKSITPTPYSLKKEDGTLIKELSVVKELQGKTCTLAIQKELDIYNGNEKERNLIHSSYNAKGQTMLEAKEGSEAVKITKVGERLKDKESKAYKASKAGLNQVEEEESGESLL